MTPLRGLPISSYTEAAAPTTGVAVPIPDGSEDPWIAATAVKIWVSAEALVGMGPDNTPPTAAAANTVIQQSSTEEVYVLGLPDDALDHIYVYAASGTIGVDVSFFG